MLLDWIDNLGLLNKDPNSNILDAFPLSLRRAVVTEVTNCLYEAMGGFPDGRLTPGGSSAAITIGGDQASSTLLAPASEGPIGKLHSPAHLRWVLEVLGQAFALPLDDIGIIGNAVAIYVAWLTRPETRPPGLLAGSVDGGSLSTIDPEMALTLLLHLTDLFSPKRTSAPTAGASGNSNVTANTAALATRHVEQCRLVLRVYVHLFVNQNSSDVMASLPVRKGLLRALLGITDNLLRMPLSPPSYLVDELCQGGGPDGLLLPALLECWIRSGIYSSRMWTSLRSLYPRWMHRSVAVSQWSSLTLGMTLQIVKLLYKAPTPDTLGLVSQVVPSFPPLFFSAMSPEFVVYAWHQILMLIGRRITNRLPPIIFHRLILGIERLVQVFHEEIPIPKLEEESQSSNTSTGALHLPDGNTILHLFGQWLFDAVSEAHPDYVDGRAQAFGVLCRILCKPQHRSSFLPVYLYQFYWALIKALLSTEELEGGSATSSGQSSEAAPSDTLNLHTLVFIIVNSEDLFAQSHPGARILFLPFLLGIRRIVPALEQPLRIAFNLDDLRRACYKLLGSLLGMCNHYGSSLFGKEQSGVLARLEDRIASLSMGLSQHVYSILLRVAFFGKETASCVINSPQATFNAAIFLLIDTLVASLLVERDAGNQRYLLNLLASAAYDDNGRIPGLAPIVIRLVVEQLGQGIWTVEASLVAVEVLKHLVSVGGGRRSASYDPTSLLSVDLQNRLIQSLCALTESLLAKNNLAVLYRLIVSLINCIQRGSERVQGLLAKNGELQAQIVNVLTRCLAVSRTSSMAATATTATSTGKSSLKKSANSSRITIDRVITGNEGKLAFGIAPVPPQGASSLEVALSEIAQSALSKLFGTFGHNLINPLRPTCISSRLTEGDILKAGESCRIHVYLLNRQSLVSMIDAEEGLLILSRTTAGRFSWETKLQYGPASLGQIYMDPADQLFDTDCEEPWEWPTSPFTFPNGALVGASKPTFPLYNDQVILGRFMREDRRARNFAIIQDLLGKTIEREHGKRLSHGPMLYCRRARPPAIEDPRGHYHRLLLAHHGAWTDMPARSQLARRPMVPLALSPQLLKHLFELDKLPERECVGCSVFYLRSGRESLAEILSMDRVSEDFMAFVRSLGWPVNLASHSGWSGGLNESLCRSFPYFASSAFELIFYVPALLNLAGLVEEKAAHSDANDKPIMSEQMGIALPAYTTALYRMLGNNFVTVLWIEDLQDLLTLPGKFQSTSLIYICVHPLTDPASAGLYRIRILVVSNGMPADTVFLLGPLLDGMLVRREVLGRLIRETVLSASAFCLYNLQNQPLPLVQRSRMIEDIANRYSLPQTITKFYTDLLQPKDSPTSLLLDSTSS